MKSQKISMAEALPDEVWIKILGIGIDKSILDYVDLCSLSICSKHFNRLSTEESVWNKLLIQDFKRYSPTSTAPYNSYPKKILYKRIIVYYRRNLKFQLMCRVGVYARKIKRIQLEMKIINEQLLENSGRLLQLIKDRYNLCRWKLAIAKTKKLQAEREISNCDGNAVKLHVDGEFFDYGSEDSSGIESEQTSEDESDSQSESGSGYDE